MKNHQVLSVCLVVALSLSLMSPVFAVPPWQSLIPFKKRVEADPNKSYALTEDRGPWMILAATFTSDEAEQEARELALELRSRYDLPAYVHMQEYDYTDTVQGRGFDKYGRPKKMRYANATRYAGYAVLVGDFESFEDPRGQKALETVKTAMPQSLDLDSGKWTLQRWKVYQELRRRLNVSDERDRKGPLGSAFITRNPLLPEELFNPGGLDPFVAKMNDGTEYSLLTNPRRYTVQVATFGGETAIDLNAKFESLNKSRQVSDKLAVAADKAHRLTVALRRKGVEAYEFHDRFASIVTVGSFDYYESATPDGGKELRADIQRIIDEYKAEQAALPGQANVGIVPKKLSGISFDVLPMVVEVPRTSIGAAYARNARR